MYSAKDLLLFFAQATAFFCWLISFHAGAQTADTTIIHGQVTDPDHAAASGVQIKIINRISGLMRTAKTTLLGLYTVPGLPIAGEYVNTADKNGVAEAQSTPVALAGGTTVQIDFQLHVNGGKTEVTVKGSVGQTRFDEPQLGDRLGAAQLEDMPLLGRKLTCLPLLNAANRPAIDQGDVFPNQNLFTTNGAGRRQNRWQYRARQLGRQTIFMKVPLAAVQEITALENAISAEYRFSAGGGVNIVTKSGGDRFHGEFLGLWRPSAPAAALASFNTFNASSANELTSKTPMFQARVPIMLTLREKSKTETPSSISASASSSAGYTALFKIDMGGISALASGLPYNIVTGTTNSGDNGAATDLSVINGTVVGRSTGRGRAIYDFSPFVERTFTSAANAMRFVSAPKISR